jgi:hypothetical protein
MPLYVARLTNGNSIIILAPDQPRARLRAQQLTINGEARIASLRELSSFAAYFALNDEGALETMLWDNPTVGEIYENEYPLLKAAFLRAHAEPLHPIMARPGWEKNLQATDEKNAAIIREGVQQERERLNPEKGAGHERSLPIPEKREFPRWPADFQLLCRFSAGSRTAKGIELSEGGLAFTTQDAYPVDAVIDLQCLLGLGALEPIVVKGLVRHVGDGIVGVQYLDLSAADRLRIITFVSGGTTPASA